MSLHLSSTGEVNLRIILRHTEPILEKLANNYKGKMVSGNIDEEDKAKYYAIMSSLRSIEELKQEMGFLKPKTKLEQITIKFE